MWNILLKTKIVIRNDNVVKFRLVNPFRESQPYLHQLLRDPISLRCVFGTDESMLLSGLMFGWDEMSPPHGSVRLLHIPLEFLHGDFLIVWQIRSPLSIYVIVCRSPRCRYSSLEEIGLFAEFRVSNKLR